MKLSTKIIIAVLAVAGSSSAVYAFSRHGGGWHMTPDEKVEFVTERVTKKLELDSQQQQNFSALAESVAQIMIDARATREQNLDEISALLQEPSLNQARLLELVQEKTRMINEKAPLVVSSLAVFLDSLDAGQKQELKEMLEHKRRHHRHDYHNHDGGQ